MRSPRPKGQLPKVRELAQGGPGQAVTEWPLGGEFAPAGLALRSTGGPSHRTGRLNTVHGPRLDPGLGAEEGVGEQA